MNKKLLRLYLASASPRRRELLRRLGFDPQVLPHAVDESRLPDEKPADFVLRLARAKGNAVLDELPTGSPSGVVLAADTVVTLGDRILGKPSDLVEAKSMLRGLSGRRHEVLTGVFAARTDDRRSVASVSSTRVLFRDLDDRILDAYVASGEPLDKAGAYGIQGRGALLAEAIEGSWSNVVGLPLETLPGCLEQIDIDPEGLFRGELRG